MHLISPSFPLVLSIFLLTTIVCPHPQLQLPSSGEPPAAFPLEKSGITAREDTTTDFPLEDVEIGSPQPLQAFGVNGGPPTAVEQFLSSTSSGSTDHGDGGGINDPRLFPSADEKQRQEWRWKYNISKQRLQPKYPQIPAPPPKPPPGPRSSFMV